MGSGLLMAMVTLNPKLRSCLRQRQQALMQPLP